MKSYCQDNKKKASEIHFLKVIEAVVDGSWMMMMTIIKQHGKKIPFSVILTVDFGSISTLNVCCCNVFTVTNMLANYKTNYNSTTMKNYE